MVTTRLGSPGLLGLEPAGQRVVLAAARLPCGAMAFPANLGRWARSAAGRAAGLFAVIAGAYVVGAELAWHHFGSGLAFGYPPSGVDVAALLLVARRRWPVVIGAIVVSEVGVDLQHHLTLAVALASALANAVEPVTGASFVRWFCAGRRPDLATRVGLGRFLLGAAVLGPVAGGLVGAFVSWASKGGWWPGLVLQWWAGDGIAVLVIGGPLLLWAQRRALVSARWLELVLVVLLATGLSVVAFRFGELASLPFLPVLAWAAFRLRDLGVVVTGAAFAAVANYMTAAGYGEFAHLGLSSPASVAVTQAYIAVVVLVGWVLAQEVAGRMSAVQDRDSARLEQAMAEARREAAELGAVLADAATVTSVGDQVSAAVRARLGAAHVVISVLAADGRRFEPLAGGDAEVQVAVMSAERTIDSDAPGPRAVRDRTPIYLADLKAPGAGIGSTAALPLLTEVGALGYLGVWWAGPREATAVEREYLRSMAETTSRALERARLREAERREHERVEALAERAHRAGRARVGQQGESWRRELTGEAENPPERPSHPLNAEPAAEPGRTLFGLPPIWLRVNCPCANCRDPRNGQRLVTITDLPRDVSVTSARRSGDRVEIVFGPDGHRAAFDAGWLSQFATGDEAGGGGPRSGRAGPSMGALGGEDDRTEDAKRLWSADEIAPAFPQGSWPLFRAEAAHRQACLAAVERDGFVVLRDVPREPGAVLTVAQSIGFVRETERGPLIDIQVGALPPSQAFTGQPVTPRTAQPFRDPLPTLGLVHCLDDAAAGGESILVDGFHAAASLRAQDPAAFAVLASTEVTFAYADARAELRATRPVIGVDPRGRIREIRLSGTHMQPLRLPPDDAVVFYAAYRAFAEMTGWPGQMLTFPLRPGDCLILDNTRILNGRTSFAGGGKRHLQMCWTDLDGLASTLALMRRPRHNGRLRS